MMRRQRTEEIKVARKIREERYDRYGPIRKMAEADGYVMIRRPRATPYAISQKEWDALAREPVDKRDRQKAFLHVGCVLY